MPLTWEFFRPLVILPSSASQWSKSRCAWASAQHLLVSSLVGIAARRLRHESERACDDSVLNSGVEPSEYANLLLDLARTLENSARSWSAALASHGQALSKEIYGDA